MKNIVAAILCITFLFGGGVPRQLPGTSPGARTPAISSVQHDPSIVSIEYKTGAPFQSLAFSTVTFEEVHRSSLFAITFLRLHFLGRAAAGLMLSYFLATQIFSSDL